MRLSDNHRRDRETFITTLTECRGNVREACRRASLPHSSHYWRLKNDLQYREAVSVALKAMGDRMVAEARERASRWLEERRGERLAKAMARRLTRLRSRTRTRTTRANSGQ